MAGKRTFSEPETVSHEMGGAVRSVSVISTGTGEVHWEHIHGSRKPALWWIFFGRRWVPLPINVYVIDHSGGLVLFDTGMDRAVMTDPDFWPEGFTGTVMRRLFRFHIGPDDTLTGQLERAGYSAGDVRKAVVSHLHSDHVGGIREIPKAELVVSGEEWENMRRPHAERHMIFRRDVEIPNARWEQISFQPTDDPSIAPFTPHKVE
jgi:N-acyl homoserine lactone hydrolase